MQNTLSCSLYNVTSSVLYTFHAIVTCTYLLNPCSRVLLEKLTGSQLVKKFPTFWTRRLITAFTSARHLSISRASSIQSISPTSHFLKIHLNIILPSTPGSPKWSPSLRVPPVYISLLPHTFYIIHPSHSSRFYHIKYNIICINTIKYPRNTDSFYWQRASKFSICSIPLSHHHVKQLNLRIFLY